MNSPSNPNKDLRIKEEIKHLAAEYVQRESNGASLVTVTNVMLGDKSKHALILFTVLPDSKQEVVLEFLKRKRKEFQEYVRAKSRIGRIPLFDFGIDFGEKNRQKADILLAKD